MLKNIDLNRLRVFHAIYTQNSITKAAKELNITPSAVSQSLKHLESEIKVQLFTRIHKKLVPTAEAKKLIDIVVPFFLELEEGMKHFLHGKKTPYGMLQLGAPSEFGKIYLTRIISQFRKAYPDVTFSLVLGNQETLLSMIAAGEVDFAIVDLFLNQGIPVSDHFQYQVEPIVDEEIILACSMSYFHQQLRGDLSLDNLLRQDFISYDHDYLAISGWFKHHFGKQSVKIKTVLTVDSIQAVLAAIENDIGLGVITSNQMHSDNIISIKSGRTEIINTISLIQLSDKIPSFTEKTFQAFLKKMLRMQA